MSISGPEIEEFAREFVRHVRDAAIAECDQCVGSDRERGKEQRWRKIGFDGELARVVIPDIVDVALFYVMYAIDQDLLHMKYVTSAGKEVDLNEVAGGELGGAYMAFWREELSAERYEDI
jgi:hypothetical protein